MPAQMDTTYPFLFFCAAYPVLSYVVEEYSAALHKAHKLKLRLKFLRNCLQEQVLPRSVLPQRILEMSHTPFDPFLKDILMKQIEYMKNEVAEAFKIKHAKKSHFDATIPSEWKDQLLSLCHHDLRHRVYTQLKNSHDNKLKLLIERSDWTTHANPNFVINLSDKQLDKTTTSALGFGLSFAISDNEINSVEIAKAFCNLEKYSDLSSENINICKGMIYSLMLKPSEKNCPKRFTKALSVLKKDQHLHITKADKSNAVVIMNKQDYINKMETLLSDENTYEGLQNNPIESVNSNFNKKVKSLLKDNEDVLKCVTSISPSLPYMYGVIKTHKPDNPVRPIISSVGSATYKLSKYLVTLLNPLIGTISSAHIKNNVDLVNKLNNTHMNCDFKLVSFDVCSLFTKVPVEDLLSFLPDVIDRLELPFDNTVLINLIKLCILDSKFEFNGKYYSQKFGMAMGNPLSPVLSNLYMEFFESKILKNFLPKNAVWFRYVDDIICLWPVNENLNTFLEKLNNQVASIKFTMELENESSLPFLDCLIHRKDRSFKYSIYRKTTNVASYVHFYSSHNDRVKQSVFSSMFLRAYRICSPEYLDDEINKIYEISTNLKYPKLFIDKCLRTARKTFYSTTDKQPYNNKNMLVLPYNENFKHLPHILKPLDVNVAFRNKNTIKHKIIKNCPQTKLGGIYQIPCKICKKPYIGQTSKSLDVRIKQHKYSIRSAQESSALFVHVRDFGHPIDWENSTTLIHNSALIERNIIESSFIKKSWCENLNLSQGIYRLDPIINKEITDRYKFYGRIS